MNNAITQTPSADRYGWIDRQRGQREGKTPGKKNKKGVRIGNERQKQAGEERKRRMQSRRVRRGGG